MFIHQRRVGIKLPHRSYTPIHIILYYIILYKHASHCTRVRTYVVTNGRVLIKELEIR